MLFQPRDPWWAVPITLPCPLQTQQPPEDLGMAQTRELARPGHIPTLPFASCGLWMQHFI